MKHVKIVAVLGILSAAVVSAETVIHVSAVGYKVGRDKFTDLQWYGATTATVEIWQGATKDSPDVNDDGIPDPIYLGIFANDGQETIQVSSRLKYTQFWVCEVPYTQIDGQLYMICGATSVNF